IKSSDATGVNVVDDTVTYTYDVENTGNVTLTNVVVTDNHVGLSAITCTPAQGSTLEPGETMTCSATYIVTQVDVDAGEINNTGVVTGTPPVGQDVSDNDPLSEPIAQGPQLDIVKSQTSNGPYVFGDTINYDIVVTNTGNVSLTGVTVIDNSATVGVCTPAQPATLALGESMTCPASHVVTQIDLDSRSYVNTATADSNETPPSDSIVTVNFGVADLSLVKTVTNTTPNYGSNINFILTVTNGGPEDATGVEVTDNLPNGFTFISASASKGTYSNATGLWQIGDLALNDSVTLNMTVRVNASGPYTNTAEIVASLLIDPDSTPDNQNPNEDDQDSVTVVPRINDDDDDDDPPSSPPQSAPAVGGFLIPVTGFAPNVTTDLSNEPFVAYGDTSITLDIPSLSVDMPIVGVPKNGGTWNVSWLGNQAGWLEGSAFPSWNGNSVLTSHVYLSNGKPGPFAKLHELKTGDKIFVHAFGQTYTFEVLTNATISPTDRSVMKHEESPWLTLVTCADYDLKTGMYKNRFIVRAVLVKVSAGR
ncbi:MAG TPA: sortase, partial [Anaerolineales bacterium]|nr:sortase [Anaerolineales bacterium]